MSVQFYINPSQVRKLQSNLQRRLITCRLCQSIAIGTLVMCKLCKRLYCQEHQQQFLGMKYKQCYCGNNLTLNIHPYIQDIFSRAKIICQCKNQYGYKQILNHKKKQKCQGQYKYKQFIWKFSDGQQKNFSYQQNISANMNYKNKSFVFLLGSYVVFLKQLKAKHELFVQKSNGINEMNNNNVFRSIRFKQVQNPNPKRHWFFESDFNPYSLYDEKSAKDIEEKFKLYHNRDGSQNRQFVLEINNTKYQINLQLETQTRLSQNKVRLKKRNIHVQFF